MRERELLITEQGISILKPTLKEKLQMRMTILLLPGTIGGLLTLVNPQAAQDAHTGLDALRAVLQIDKDYRKGRFKGEVRKVDPRVEQGSSIQEIARLKR